MSYTTFDNISPMKRFIHAVIVDIDDCLAATEEFLHVPVWKQLYSKKDLGTKDDGIKGINELLQKQGFPIAEIGMRPRDIIERIETALLQQSDSRKSTDEIRLHVWMQEKKRVHLLVERVKDSTFKIESTLGSFELMSSLREEEIPVIALTSNAREYAEELLKRLDLYQYVEEIVSGDILIKDKKGGNRFIRAKPDPEPFEIGLKLFNEQRRKKGLVNLSSRNIVTFGDSPSDMIGANRAGMWGIGLETKHRLREELFEAGSVLVIKDFREIDLRIGGTFESYPFGPCS